LEPAERAALSARGGSPGALPGPGESLDRLTPGRRVLQRKHGHRSATDDVLLAWLAWSHAPVARRVLDLGCGHGTVTLLLSELLPAAKFTAIEVQPVSADLARRNVALNGLGDRVRVLEMDLRDFSLDLDDLPFELVTGTPPFMPMGTGKIARDPQRAAARFELRGGIEAYCAAAAGALRPGGMACLLMDASQDGRCWQAFAEAGLELLHVHRFEPRPGAALRFLGYVGRRPDPRPSAAARPHAGPSTATLRIREADGRYTGEMLALRRAVGVEPP
jgi:tRNA1(Val) A37 N6-methylase TrmN6